MDGQTDVGHINLIGRLVTRNPPKNEMNNIYEKISLTVILLKIFDIFFCHYFAINNKNGYLILLTYGMQWNPQLYAIL